MGLGPTLVTSFYLHHLFKDPVSKHSHILRCWGSGLQHGYFRDTGRPVSVFWALVKYFTSQP